MVRVAGGRDTTCGRCGVPVTLYFKMTGRVSGVVANQGARLLFDRLHPRDIHRCGGMETAWYGRATHRIRGAAARSR